MAAGRLQKPGIDNGPCEDECQHTDCKLTKQMAETRCFYCQLPIGYDSGFYTIKRNGNDMLTHSVCHESTGHIRPFYVD